METLQQTGAILLVLALLGSALYVLKRNKLAIFSGMPGRVSSFRGERRLQVLERVSLGPQHAICLVRVGDRTVMVTTSPANCQIAESPLP